MKEICFDIEDYYGNTMMKFVGKIKNNEIVLTNYEDCSIADIEQEHGLTTYRIQSENINY